MKYYAWNDTAVISLNQEQIERCYDVYDFQDNEEIIGGTFDFFNYQLSLDYIIDKDELDVHTYEPNCSDPEDERKIIYILTGGDINAIR